MDRRILVEERMASIGIPQDVFLFFFSCLNDFVRIVGELAGGGSVAVAVGVTGNR